MPITAPDALAAAFEGLLATGSHGPVDVTAAFGTDAIRIRLHNFPPRTAYGQALRRAAPDSVTIFTVHVIDGAACDVDRPRLTWTVADFGPKRRVPGWSDRAHTTYLLRGEEGIAVADWERNRAFVWLPSHQAVPWYEYAAPLRWLFDDLAERRGLSTLHAAAVGLGGYGILLAGAGGAGKSTLALAALGEGFDYVGDDYCLLSHADPEVFALYSTAKWDKEARIKPGWLTTDALYALQCKAAKNVAFLEKIRPEKLADRLTITAIVLPAIGGTLKPMLEAVAPPVALRALSASSLAQSEAGAPALVAALAKLVKSAPAYRLHMTPRPAENVALIRTLLAELDR